MNDHTLQRPDARLSIDPDGGALTIQIGSISLYGHCAAQIEQPRLKLTGNRVEELSGESCSNRHGSGKMLRVRYRPHQSGLALTLEAAQYEAHPFFALRIGLTNHGQQPVTLSTLTSLATTEMHFGSEALDGWVNGFHSWDYTGFVPHDVRLPRTPFGRLTWPLAHNPTTNRPFQEGIYASEQVGALIERDRQALIAGFIGVEDQFGQVFGNGRPGKKSLTLRTTADGVPLKPGETLWGEWAILYRVDLPHPDPIGVYAEAAARLTPPRILAQPPQPGWSSWYQFFDKVTAKDMQRNQQTLVTYRDRLPLGLIQLDDGYQPVWGDWLKTNDKFPDGIGAWADGVRSDGFTPGLWLSPFTVNLKSEFVQQHPETVLRNDKGRPSFGGFLFDQFIYGLDPTHPVVQDYLRQVFETVVHDWGIPYLKLDFLYCGALPGRRYDPGRTRAQALRDGLKLIREVAGKEAVILGCGCPLGSALGIADIFRVSMDVAPDWTPRLFGIGFPFKKMQTTLPATRNTLRGTLNRVWTHKRWWWLDADNLMVREQQNMTADEVKTLATVMALTGSHLVTSDDLPLLSDERLSWAASLLPLVDGETESWGIFSDDLPDTLIRRMTSPTGSYTLVAYFTWDGMCPKPFKLPFEKFGLPADQPMLVCDFWNQCQLAGIEETNLSFEAMDKHSAALQAVRPLEDGPQYAGSDLHISMGGEVSSWQVSDSELRFTVDLNRKADGEIWLKLPLEPSAVLCQGQPVEFDYRPGRKPEWGGICTLHVSIDGRAEFVVS